MNLYQKEGDRFCERCNYWKNDRTHHCGVCNKCIMGMDHHCKLYKEPDSLLNIIIIFNIRTDFKLYNLSKKYM